MCIAAAAEIVEIYDGKKFARACVMGNKLDINISLISPEIKIGDYVLVHAGCAIEIIQKETADEIEELYKMLEESS